MTLLMTKDAAKSFDFSPWGGIDGFLKASQTGANTDVAVLKRRVPDLARALDMTSIAVASLPFEILTESGDIFDESGDWQNKLGGLPNPTRLLYLLASSLCGGAAYVIPTRTSRMIIDLQYAAPHTIQPQIDYNGLQAFDRNTDQGRVEKYQPDEILYYWLPDSDIEIGPAENTPLSNAQLPAMLIYSMENTLKNYGDRGFVPLMLLNVKGMVAEGERTKLENWWNRLLNFGFKERAKVTNGEAVEAVPLGAGMEELKGSYTEIRRTAEESIADAFGIPSALFMSDNAYASEFVELRKQWYSSSRFVSLYQTIQEVMTDQLYKAYGYKWRFALETLDIFQADESKRALSLASIVQAVTTDPAAAQFGMGVLGYDLTKEQQDQLDEIITTKEEEKEQLQEQIAAGQVDMNGKPIAQKPKGEQEKESRDSERQDTEKKPPKRKALEPEQVAALATWQKNAVRWYEHSGGTKNGADWRCDLPDDIAAPIRAKLQAAKTIEDVRSAFVVTITDTPAPVYAPPTMSYSDDAVKALAQAIERAAESTKAEPQAPPNYTLNLTAQMPAAGEPTINFSPVIQPSEVKAEPSVIVNVEPTPVTVQNDVTVQPADVTVIDKGKHKATVKRDRDGNITGIEAK